MTVIATRRMPLADRLRHETRSVHEAAERSQLMSALSSGTLPLPRYTALLAQLHHVYDALESATRDMRSSRFACLLDERLDRADAIARDLEFLGGVPAPATAGTAAYVARIARVADEEPVRVIAHHYTRYLGDLSGGQVVASVLQRHLGVRGPEGLEFYHFDIGPLPHYKRSYRDKLDSMCADQTEEDGVVDEARCAFALNIALFDSLETR